MLEGGCQCGKVRYRLTDEPIFVNACHCRDCQRFSGSAFAVNAMIETDRIEITGEIPPIPATESEPARCAACGTRLWGHIAMFGPPIAFVFVGTLDQGEQVLPSAHFFTRSKHRWVTIPPGLPAFETLPRSDGELWRGPVRARLKAALAGSGASR